MNDIVKKIINYLEIQNPSVIINKSHVDNLETLNCVCFEILAWLKLERKREIWISEGKKTCLKPLELNSKYEWCNLLMLIIQNEPLFHETFEIKDDKLFLQNDLSDETKTQIRNDAFQLYNPTPIVN